MALLLYSCALLKAYLNPLSDVSSNCFVWPLLVQINWEASIAGCPSKDLWRPFTTKMGCLNFRSPSFRVPINSPVACSLSCPGPRNTLLAFLRFGLPHDLCVDCDTTITSAPVLPNLSLWPLISMSICHALVLMDSRNATSLSSEDDAESLL